MIATEGEFEAHSVECATKIQKSDSQKRVKCAVCTRQFSNQRCLSVHMLSHKDGDVQNSSWVCETCGKEFPFKKYLNEHLQRMHRFLE